MRRNPLIITGASCNATVALVCLLFISSTVAQAPGVVIEQTPAVADPGILEKVTPLRESGALKLDHKAVARQLEAPAGGSVSLQPPRTTPMSSVELARFAREKHVQLGWVYLCTRCDKWHLNFAGAYAIAADVVVTCHHSMTPEMEMREGYLLVMDSSGQVMPVTSVMAASKAQDTVILKVDGRLSPIALNEDVSPGESIYCFSAPENNRGYFSHGIVNRFYWQGKPGESGADTEWDNLRMNVDCDWAPGSSGAAVLDACGNAVGHVSTISAIFQKHRSPSTQPGDDKARDSAPTTQRSTQATWMTLHHAIPARGVMSVVKRMSESQPEATSNPAAGN